MLVAAILLAGNNSLLVYIFPFYKISIVKITTRFICSARFNYKEALSKSRFDFPKLLKWKR